MKKNKPPTVSIIIATKNEEMKIVPLLDSIEKQIYRHIETILVDNFSTDATIPLAKTFKTKIYSHGTERSNQRNFGASKARGDYFLFLDADMELPPRVVFECVQKIKQNKHGALIIPEDTKGTSLYLRIKRIEKRLYYHEPTLEAARFFAAGIFRKIGGYNQDLIAGEDWDISIRASKICTIGSTTTPLFHQETSFFRELGHKRYYLKHIHKYAKLHPQIYARQSSWRRIPIYFKWSIIQSDPLAFIGLLGLKWIELLLVSFF